MNNTPKPASQTVTAPSKDSWSGVLGNLIISAVLVGLAMFIMHRQTEQRFQALEKETTRLQASPNKILVLDLKRLASDWHELSQEQIIEAGDALIKSYARQGYIVLDRAAVLGEIPAGAEFVYPSAQDVMKMFANNQPSKDAS